MPYREMITEFFRGRFAEEPAENRQLVAVNRSIFRGVVAVDFVTKYSGLPKRWNFAQNELLCAQTRKTRNLKKMGNSHNFAALRRQIEFQLPQKPMKLGRLSVAMGRSVENGFQTEQHPPNYLVTTPIFAHFFSGPCLGAVMAFRFHPGRTRKALPD